jgi:hypothetical protein
VRSPTLPLPVIPEVPAGIQEALDLLTWIAERQAAGRETGELPAYATSWGMHPVKAGVPRHGRRAWRRVAFVLRGGVWGRG